MWTLPDRTANRVCPQGKSILGTIRSVTHSSVNDSVEFERLRMYGAVNQNHIPR